MIRMIAFHLLVCLVMGVLACIIVVVHGIYNSKKYGFTEEDTYGIIESLLELYVPSCHMPISGVGGAIFGLAVNLALYPITESVIVVKYLIESYRLVHNKMES